MDAEFDVSEEFDLFDIIASCIIKKFLTLSLRFKIMFYCCRIFTGMSTNVSYVAYVGLFVKINLTVIYIMLSVLISLFMFYTVIFGLATARKSGVTFWNAKCLHKIIECFLSVCLIAVILFLREQLDFNTNWKFYVILVISGFDVLLNPLEVGIACWRKR